jgi:histidyl-tRNA synthetase
MSEKVDKTLNVPAIVDGMYDILPDYHKYFTFLKKVFRHEFRKNGFRRISTPIFESKQLFSNTTLKDCKDYN